MYTNGNGKQMTSSQYHNSADKNAAVQLQQQFKQLGLSGRGANVNKEAMDALASQSALASSRQQYHHQHQFAPYHGSGQMSASASEDEEELSWIQWFCSDRGNEFFCEVDEDYVHDDFNLTGLHLLVPCYDYALDMILDIESHPDDPLTKDQQEIVESAAEMLYGLIHARYIVTNRGMHAMYEKYRNGAFGVCPRVFCEGQPLLPVGLSDLPRNYTVKTFCPRCHDLYVPKSRSANIDGAYFGTTFPHLYLMTHPDIIPQQPTHSYAPRVYGFKINESSPYYQRREERREEQLQVKEPKQRSRRFDGRK